MQELRYGWKAGEKIIDERAIASCHGELKCFKARLNMEAPDMKSILDYFLHFSPLTYEIEQVIPLINELGYVTYGAEWTDIDLGVFLRYLGLRFYQEVTRLPCTRWYWEAESDGLFPAHNLGRFMPRIQFEQISSCLVLSSSVDDEAQVLDFIKELNAAFQAAIIPSSTIVLDESMVKSYHRKMPGIKKIMRKPRPIGVELKVLADGSMALYLILRNMVRLSTFLLDNNSDQQGW